MFLCHLGEQEGLLMRFSRVPKDGSADVCSNLGQEQSIWAIYLSHK